MQKCKNAKFLARDFHITVYQCFIKSISRLKEPEGMRYEKFRRHYLISNEAFQSLTKA